MFGGEDFLGDDHIKCALCSEYPADISGAAMWPEGMNEAIYEEIKRNASNSANPELDPFLSPFTSVYWVDREKKILGWRSFYNDPLFHDDIEKISSILEEAAVYSECANKKSGNEIIDNSFINQLRTHAKTLRSGDPYPFRESDAAWMRAGGPLKLCIGPYEAYKDTLFHIKATFQFLLGAEDRKRTEETAKFTSYKQKAENIIAGLAGSVYTKRCVDSHITPTPFINIILSAGDVMTDGPATLAHNLPNLFRNEIGFIIEMFDNHYEAKKEILKEIAKIAIVQEQQKYIDHYAFIDTGIYHELTHALGPTEDYRVTAPDGIKTTVSNALGSIFHSIEEAKADTGMLIFSDMIYGRNSEKFKKDAVTAIASLFRQTRFGLESHGMAGIIRLAYFIEKGGIDYINGRFKVNFDKTYELNNELMKEIVTIGATGDKKRADTFMNKYRDQGQNILKEVLAKIEAAHIPIDVHVNYKILNG